MIDSVVGQLCTPAAAVYTGHGNAATASISCGLVVECAACNKLYNRSATNPNNAADPILHLFRFAVYDKSTADRKPTASPRQKSTTSCATESESYSELDNLSHSKSTTSPQQVACNDQQVAAQLVDKTNPQLIEVVESAPVIQHYYMGTPLL